MRCIYQGQWHLLNPSSCSYIYAVVFTKTASYSCCAMHIPQLILFTQLELVYLHWRCCIYQVSKPFFLRDAYTEVSAIYPAPVVHLHWRCCIYQVSKPLFLRDAYTEVNAIYLTSCIYIGLLYVPKLLRYLHLAVVIPS